MSETVQHTTYKWGLAPLAIYTALTVVQLRARKKDQAQGHKEEK
jgi:hypothetical protein